MYSGSEVPSLVILCGLAIVRINEYNIFDDAHSLLRAGNSSQHYYCDSISTTERKGRTNPEEQLFPTKPQINTFSYDSYSPVLIPLPVGSNATDVTLADYRKYASLERKNQNEILPSFYENKWNKEIIQLKAKPIWNKYMGVKYIEEKYKNDPIKKEMALNLYLNPFITWDKKFMVIMDYVLDDYIIQIINFVLKVIDYCHNCRSPCFLQPHSFQYDICKQCVLENIETETRRKTMNAYCYLNKLIKKEENKKEQQELAQKQEEEKEEEEEPYFHLKKKKELSYIKHFSSEYDNFMSE